eukprot:PITA_09112
MSENGFTGHGSEMIIDTVCKQEQAPSSSCAACKIQRKKCTEKCVLAPYFPQDEAKKFMLVHGVFGNGHVIKLLQDLPPELRGEAVSSMVYEANERLRDPVNGCLGVINDLRRRVAELELQLASTQEAFADLYRKYIVLLTLITGCHEGSHPNFYSTSPQETQEYCGTNPCSIVVDDLDPLQL